MSGEWHEHQQQDEDDEEARGASDLYHAASSGRYPRGARPGGRPADAPPSQRDPAHVGEGGAAPDGGWVEGPGWRMKAPAEKKRQQVCRLLLRVLLPTMLVCVCVCVCVCV